MFSTKAFMGQKIRHQCAKRKHACGSNGCDPQAEPKGKPVNRNQREHSLSGKTIITSEPKPGCRSPMQFEVTFSPRPISNQLDLTKLIRQAVDPHIAPPELDRPDPAWRSWMLRGQPRCRCLGVSPQKSVR